MTGAASGIGRAMVEAFRNARARVVAADIAPDPGWPADVLSIQADVSRADDVERIVSQSLRLAGRIDVLCNNAGIPDRFEGADECSDETWERTLAVNLHGPFLMTRRVLGPMLARRAGVIINTASVASFRGGEAGVAYTVAKHGLLGLTRSVAAMYGEDGIRCLAICPGPVTTGITRLNAERRAAGELSRRGQATAAKTAALRWRWAEPAEVAALAVFAAGDEAAALNGCAIPADSGRMLF